MTSRQIHLTCLLIMAAFLGSGSPAWSQDQVSRGEQAFRQCVACHAFDPADRKPGPHLQGIFGREAGSVEGFRYSRAMSEAGFVWDEERLGAYIVDPRGTLPGTSMLVPLRDNADLTDLLAYLRIQSDGGQ